MSKPVDPKPAPTPTQAMPVAPSPPNNPKIDVRPQKEEKDFPDQLKKTK